MRISGKLRLVGISAWLLVFAVTLSVALRVHALSLHSDGMFYFAQLRSLYFDRDIDFRNEARQFPWISATFGQPLPNGRLANPFAVGAPIHWSPFYAVADSLCKTGGSGNCHGYTTDYGRSW